MQIVGQVADREREAFISTGWWHSIELPDGRVTPGAHLLDELKQNYARFALPAKLAGKRVLDIGCWDGFYSFEAERNGAQVVSVDCWTSDKFLYAREQLRSQAQFHELSVYEVTAELLGQFDIVFFLGVLYHLRHPLLALERVCEVTQDFAIIESHVADGLVATSQPVMEFYELDELGGQYDNWWGPNTECLVRMARAAGFCRVEVLRHHISRSVIKAHRRWEQPVQSRREAIKITAVTSSVDFSRAIPHQGRHAMLSIWVEGLPADANRREVQLEIGGLGALPYFIGHLHNESGAAYAHISAEVPRGLRAGKVPVTVSYRDLTSNTGMAEIVQGPAWHGGL